MNTVERKYYARLEERIFKILLVYESQDANMFQKYSKSLYTELCGNDKYPEVFEVRYKINGIIVHEADHDTIRKTVFECRNIIKKMVENSKEC